MGVISDVVEVTITSEAAKVSQTGFGLPLIVSHSAAWAERVREYTSLTDVAVDFLATSPEYLAAAKVFGQSPRPPSLLIGRAANAPTQRWAITPVAVDSHTYEVTIDGQTASFTADASATVAEVIAGLKAAIDLLGLAVTTTDMTTYLRIVANAAGAWHNLSANDVNVGVAQEHTDPGIAADLAAIALERNDWYGLITLFNSAALIAAAAAYCETAKKLYVAATQDTAVPNTAISGTDDVAEILKAAAYKKTALIFSKATGDFPDAAAIGRCFPITPGEETWKFKTLAGVTAGSYTATQRTNMRAKSCNFYEPTAGVNMLEEGITSSGAFIDFVRYLDYLEARIGERCFGRIAAPNKLPMNDRGISVIRAEVAGQLQSDEGREALLPGSTVSVPKASEISSANRTARVLPSVTFSAVYAGAIHSVQINGTVVA